jgi:hypothetical protein
MFKCLVPSYSFLKVGMKISKKGVNNLLEHSGSYPDYIQRLGLRLYQLGFSQGKVLLMNKMLKMHMTK